MALVRKQTYITLEQDRALKRVAAQAHRTEAEVIRQALDNWLRRSDRNGAMGEDDPFDVLVGWFDGPEDVNHNDIYG